jgi:cell division protein FtsA
VHEVARAVALGPDRELLHAIPVEYVVDHQRGIKDPVGMNGTRLEAEVHLVSCSATAAGNLRKAVTRAGYAVQELVLEPVATARAVLTEDEKEVGAAMVEIGASSTEMAVYYEGKLRHVAVIPIAGTAVTTDLVKGLSIPFA